MYMSRLFLSILRGHHFRSLQTMAKHKRPHKPPNAKKPPLTHFLCLPLVTSTSKPQLEASLAKFRDAVTSPEASVREYASKHGESADDAARSYVHPKAVRPVGALHCTLGVMSLKEDQLEEAIDVLKGLRVQDLLRSDSTKSVPTESIKSPEQDDEAPTSLERPISPPELERPSKPLIVDLKGLESMHAPQKTSILYTAPFDASERLYSFCLSLQKTFKDKGLLVEDDRALKLHATVVNTIYAKGRKRPQRPQAAAREGSEGKNDRSSGHGPNANAPLKIDATSILEKYKDYVWAENVVLDRIAICEMGAKKILDDQGNVKAEEYTEVATISLLT